MDILVDSVSSFHPFDYRSVCCDQFAFHTLTNLPRGSVKVGSMMRREVEGYWVGIIAIFYSGGFKDLLHCSYC